MTGIVIVTWNSEEIIGECLDACLRLADVEIVVVDNASSDNTRREAEKRRGVRIIANSQNRGFASGVNQGVAALRHPAVLILNPDATPLTGIAELAAAATQADTGAAAGYLYGSDGKWQAGFNLRRFPTPLALCFEVLGINRMFPRNEVNQRWRMDDTDLAPDPAAAGDVEQPAGAFLMLNRVAWTAIGGFDEAFHPAWFEDVDYCLRLQQAGYRIQFVPVASARHLGGHSASRLSWQHRQLFWYGSLLRYAKKHFENAGRRQVAAAVMFASPLRLFAGLITGQSLKSVSVYIDIFRTAARVWHGSDTRAGVAGSPSREEKRARQFFS
ncbi:MAG: glycosyltransferase family 2 protein [Bryobacteraceae bacterium]|nr:glycosyltransferase family 2 protein [Bryobacteraceae bacterium]